MESDINILILLLLRCHYILRKKKKINFVLFAKVLELFNNCRIIICTYHIPLLWLPVILLENLKGAFEVYMKI